MEAFVDRLSTDVVAALIDDMTSTWLEPRIHVRVRDADEQIAVRLVFASASVGSFLQLRVRLV